MPKEDEPRGIIAPLKEKIGLVLMALSPGSIIKQINKMKSMSPPELIIYILTTSFWITCLFGSCFLSILGFLLTLMRGSFGQEVKSSKELELLNSKKSKKLKGLHHLRNLLQITLSKESHQMQETLRRRKAGGKSQ